MASSSLERRMTGLDASFLYLENETTPMHIGGVTLLEDEVSVDAIRKSLDAKMQFIPRYTQKVIFPPMHVGHPVYEDDAEFDIDNHVIPVDLPQPGTDAQLRRLAGKLFERMLDRDKPLWRAYVVQGYEGSRTAIIWLVHHCMVDGVSGAELLAVSMDTSPNPDPVEKKAKEPEPGADGNQQILDALWDSLSQQVDNWTQVQKNFVSLARGMRGGGGFPLMREAPALAKDFGVPVKMMPFNSFKMSGKRRLSWDAVSFTEARGIRSEIGGTVNDVVLATLAGGVRKYLEHHEVATKGKRLRVMVPVSMRREDERGKLGNKVSILPVDIPIGSKDPIRRLRAVTERTSVLKRANVAEWLNIGTELFQTSFPIVQATVEGAAMSPAAQTILRSIAITPGMHMVCTNVPGPQIPLYLNGSRVVAHYPLLPVAPPMTLNMGIFSYNHKLHFGFISDTAGAQDVHRFCQFVVDAFHDLREAAGVPEAPVFDIGRKRKATKKRAKRNGTNGTNGSSTNGAARNGRTKEAAEAAAAAASETTEAPSE